MTLRAVLQVVAVQTGAGARAGLLVFAFSFGVAAGAAAQEPRGVPDPSQAAAAGASGAASFPVAAGLPAAADLPVAVDLPAADDLIRAYVEAIGGAEAFLESASRMRGTVAIAALGVEGTFEILQAPPNRMLVRMSFPGIGETLQGYDGETGWSLNPITGPALMRGEQLEQTIEQAEVRASLRDPVFVPGRETVERASYDGSECWKVRLTWASGRESFDCYSVETGLLVASEATQASPMGEIPATTVYGAYEEFDGRMVPTRLVQRALGQEQVLTVLEVDFGPLPGDAFDLPPSIRTLRGDGG